MKKHLYLTRTLSLLLTMSLLLGFFAVPFHAAGASPGDLDGAGSVDVADILRLKDLILSGSWTPEELAAGDLNNNDRLDVADIMLLKKRIIEGPESADPTDTIKIKVLGRTSVLAAGEDSLSYTGLQPGDAVEFRSDYRYIWVKINDLMGENLIYSETGVFTFQVPKATDCYPANAFSGVNEISARVATAEEIGQRRNLAVNAYDFKYADEETIYNADTVNLVNNSPAVEAGMVQAYPHAYANRVTENKTIFNARNAIDGVTTTGNNHSNYPYQSWGCGKYDDAEFVVYFGREVEIDTLAVVLRADFSGSVEHDTYWESITAEFSDGSTQTIHPVKGGSKQSFEIEPVTTSYVRLKNLVRHENANSGMWAALTELEVYGSDIVHKNPVAESAVADPDFGDKEMVETIDTLSADEIAETIDSVYRYFTANIGVNDDGWKEGVYYVGLTDAYLSTGELDYYLDFRAAAESFGYKVNSGTLTDYGDDYCISQMYLALNKLSPDPYKLEGTIANADYNISLGKLDYHWCDALFMSGMVFTELTNLTGNEVYSDTEFATHLEWKAQLYSEEYDLWYRDLYWKGRKTESGDPIFWSRGNAWVFAYLARQLAYMTDTNSEAYQHYLQEFKAMAAALKPLQRADGTWNPCLNDPDHFGGIETTGTAGFLYGYAIGVQLGILDREEYLPVALKAYDALTGLCMLEDGKIGYMEQEADAPEDYISEEHTKPMMNSFGTGLFLMGASALMRMCEDYEVPELEVPLDTQDRSYSRFSVEPGYYKGAVTATASASQEGNEVEHLFDYDVTGTAGTRWSAEGLNNWAMADLGKNVALHKVCVYTLDARDYRYKVEVSDDGNRWVTVVDRSESNTSEFYYMDTFQPIYARYVRLTTNGAQTYNGGWISISEMLLYEYTGSEEILEVEDVYEDPYEGITFVPGTVTASYSSAEPASGYYTGNITTTATYEEEGNEAANLFNQDWSDAATGARWAAAGYPNSATADLGQVLSLSKLTMMVYQGRQYYYQLEVSTDGSNWQTVGIVNRAYQNAENHTYTLSEPVEARYLRLTVTGSNPSSYNNVWISIKELLLYTAN